MPDDPAMDEAMQKLERETREERADRAAQIQREAEQDARIAEALRRGEHEI
jgi:hypothetical protein